MELLKQLANRGNSTLGDLLFEVEVSRKFGKLKIKITDFKNFKMYVTIEFP